MGAQFTADDVIKFVPIIEMLAKLGLQFLQNEQTRGGMTTDEVFARAGVTLDANTAKLLDDLTRLSAGTPSA